MTVSYTWLKEYLQFDLTPEEVGRILTDTGLEVEHVEEVEQIPGGLAGVIVAQVVECEPHPDSDHLHVTKLNTGEAELLQVVCGAPNVAAGQKVLLATIGTKLPDGEGGEFKIKRSKIRGVESNGMICAEDELGIGTDHAGIMVLSDDAVPGTSAKDYLHLKSDTVYEIGLTPNRVDGASQIGAARDLYAWMKAHGVPCERHLPDVSAFREGAGEAIPVEVIDPALAPRYIGITLRGVKVGPSPAWLQERLTSIGQRPINNVVDVTNFVLNEMGHPLHAFDVAKIRGRKVVVRRADEGAKFVTLDGVERTLSPDDLVICDTVGPMCLAGVFGGAESGVSETTTDIFLEAAYFNPVSIRKTAKRHGLKTDASFRYERGVDPSATMTAARRAVLLLQEVAGAEVVGKVQEVYPKAIAPAEVELDFARMERLIGKHIGAQTILDILRSLDFEVLSSNADGAKVRVPQYRVDVTRECDVVEEVLRIYGYNNVELPERMTVSINPSQHPDPEAVRSLVSNMLADWGFVETMNNSLTKADYYRDLKTCPAANLVQVVNPLSSDLNVMRQCLLPNALEVIAYNINRQMPSLKIFELGNVYSFVPKEGVADPVSSLDSYHEEMRLCFAISGPAQKMWRSEIAQGHYFALKGYLETLLKRFGTDIYNLECDAAPADLFSEGLVYKVGNKTLAMAGTVNPAFARRFDVRQPVFACELSWPVLFRLIKRNHVQYSELPKYPEVRRDLALLFDEEVSFADLRKAAFGAERKLLRQVGLFDVYRGAKILPGKKQYAMSFIFRDDERTLTDEAIERMMARLLSMFQERFGAILR